MPVTPRPGQVRILLVVDDDPALRAGLARALHGDGRRILEAGSGPAALDALARQPVDVLVTDQAMPGMTGLELLAEARRRYPGTGRVLLTGQTDLAAAAVEAGDGLAEAVLYKPCEIAELREAVRAVLRARGGPGG